MDTSARTMNTLFEQLGLPAADADIDAFVAHHSPLKSGVTLDDAPFWNTAQSQFVRDAWCEDSDWTELVDQLDTLLR